MLASPTNFLDNLKNLGVVMSVALEHVQGNRDQFAKSATGVQARQAEKIHLYGQRLNRTTRQRIYILEYLIEGRPTIPRTTHTHKMKSPAPIRFHGKNLT